MNRQIEEENTLTCQNETFHKSDATGCEQLEMIDDESMDCDSLMINQEGTPRDMSSDLPQESHVINEGIQIEKQTSKSQQQTIPGSDYLSQFNAQVLIGDQDSCESETETGHQNKSEEQSSNNNECLTFNNDCLDDNRKSLYGDHLSEQGSSILQEGDMSGLGSLAQPYIAASPLIDPAQSNTELIDHCVRLDLVSSSDLNEIPSSSDEAILSTGQDLTVTDTIIPKEHEIQGQHTESNVSVNSDSKDGPLQRIMAENLSQGVSDIGITPNEGKDQISLTNLQVEHDTNTFTPSISNQLEQSISPRSEEELLSNSNSYQIECLSGQSYEKCSTPINVESNQHFAPEGVSLIQDLPLQCEEALDVLSPNDTLNSTISEVVGEVLSAQFSDSSKSDGENNNVSQETSQSNTQYKVDSHYSQDAEPPKSDASDLEGLTPRSNTSGLSASTWESDITDTGGAHTPAIPEHLRKKSLTEVSSIDFNSSTSDLSDSSLSDKESKGQLVTLCASELDRAQDLTKSGLQHDINEPGVSVDNAHSVVNGKEADSNLDVEMTEPHRDAGSFNPEVSAADVSSVSLTMEPGVQGQNLTPEAATNSRLESNPLIG